MKEALQATEGERELCEYRVSATARRANMFEGRTLEARALLGSAHGRLTVFGASPEAKLPEAMAAPGSFAELLR